MIVCVQTCVFALEGPLQQPLHGYYTGLLHGSDIVLKFAQRSMRAVISAADEHTEITVGLSRLDTCGANGGIVCCSSMALVHYTFVIF